MQVAERRQQQIPVWALQPVDCKCEWEMLRQEAWEATCDRAYKQALHAWLTACDQCLMYCVYPRVGV